MTTTSTLTTIKHESADLGLHTSYQSIRNSIDTLCMIRGLEVVFYGRHEYDATANVYVKIPERNELHVFKNNTDAKGFIDQLFWEAETKGEFADLFTK